MRLDEIDWRTITPDQAGRLLGAAKNRLTKAENVYRESGADEDETAMLAAYQTYEDLQVLHLTGERPGEG